LWLLLLAVSSSLAMMLIGQRSGDLQWQLGSATQTALLILSLILIFGLGKGNPKSFGFAKPDSLQVFSCAGWGVLLGVGVSIATTLTGGENAMPDYRMSLVQQILFVWLWASMCEEIFLRGLIQSYLSPLGSRRVNIFNLRISLPVFVSAVLFGLMHLGLLGTGVQTAVVFVVVIFSFGLGLVAGYYRERSGSLLPAVLVHMFGNIGGSLAAWLHLGS
jgi:membrane protease YdiL (CAAX protease family)